MRAVPGLEESVHTTRHEDESHRHEEEGPPDSGDEGVESSLDLQPQVGRSQLGMEEADGAAVLLDVLDDLLFILDEDRRIGPALEDEGEPVFLIFESIRFERPLRSLFKGIAFARGQDDDDGDVRWATRTARRSNTDLIWFSVHVSRPMSLAMGTSWAQPQGEQGGEENQSLHCMQ